MSYTQAWIISAVFALLCVLAVDAGEREECRTWNKIKDTLRRERGVNVTCTVNQLCTGLNCSGAFSFQLPGRSVTERARFGLMFDTCSEPTSLGLYVNTSSSDYNSSSYRRLIVQPQATTYNLSVLGIKRQIPVGNVDGIVTVYIAHTTTARLLTLEVNFTLKGVALGNTFSQTITLVPRSNVTIPPCGTSSTTPGSTRHYHPKPKPGVHQPHTTTHRPNTTTVSPSEICPDFPERNCTPTTAHQCGDHQQCTGSPSKCACFRGYHWDGQNCINSSLPCNGGSEHKGHSQSGLIAALSCLVAALLIGSVIALVRYKYVRYRQRYGQHDVLINNDADNDLDDDADPPMIEA